MIDNDFIMTWFTMITVSALVVVAAGYDFRSGRIPNRLTYSGLAVGLALAAVTSGLTVGNALTGVAVGGGLFLLFWLGGGIGAGDVKLMAALGALLGWPRIWDVVFLTALCGAVMGILFLIWRRIPAVTADGETSETVSRRKQKMPYAGAIAAGAILAMIFG